jgi:hypothetical protein
MKDVFLPLKSLPITLLFDLPFVTSSKENKTKSKEKIKYPSLLYKYLPYNI